MNVRNVRITAQLPIAVQGSLRVRSGPNPGCGVHILGVRGLRTSDPFCCCDITTVMKSSVVSKGLIFVSQHTVHLEGKSGQEMEQRPWKDAAHCLVCHGSTCLSMYKPGPSLQRWHCPLCNGPTCINQGNSLTASPTGQSHGGIFLIGFFSSQMTLSCAKLTRKQTKLASLDPLTGLSKWAPLPIFLDGAQEPMLGPVAEGEGGDSLLKVSLKKPFK